MGGMRPRPVRDLVALASLRLLARFWYVVLIVVTVVQLSYSAVHDTLPELAPYGGLGNCLHCGSGWNWHVLLFTFAFAFCKVESVLVYHGYGCIPRTSSARKWVHLAWQLAALTLTIIGMIAIVLGKLATSSKHYYSVHAWTGTLVLALLAFQFCMGAGAFVFRCRKCLSSKQQLQLAAVHRFWGKVTLFAGLGVCVNGWADQQMMMVDSGQYTYRSATLLQAVCGVLTAFVATTVFSMLYWEPHESSLLPATSDASKGLTERSESDSLQKGLAESC